MSDSDDSPVQIVEVKGNLFECSPSDSLVHCVSEDLAMGKGIAVEFKKRFGGVEKLKKQKRVVGEVAILDVPAPESDSGHRFVYYMITKLRYFHKPTYDTFEASLIAMRDHMISHGVTQLSMPRIGCGLDQLQWPKVRALIARVFQGTGVTISVYSI